MIDPAERLTPDGPPVDGALRVALAALDTFHRIAAARIDVNDPAATLQAVVDGVAAGLPADRVTLAIVDDSARRVIDYVRSGPGDPPAGRPDFEEYRRGPTGWVLDNRQPLAVEGSAEPDGPGPLVVAPLKFKDETIGTLEAVRASGKPAFTSMDIELVSAMANQAVLVIGYSRRLRSEQIQRKLAETLQRVTSAITSTLDLSEVLDGVLDGLGQVLIYDAAAVLLSQDDQLRVMAARGLAASELFHTQGIRVRAGDVFAEPLSTGQPVVVHDWSADERRSTYVKDERLRAWMAVPMLARNQPIGMVTVGSFRPNAFTDAEVAIADAFGNQAAVAIQNARLFQRTQVALAKSETLYSTAQALIASDSLAEVLQSVVDGAVRAIPADRVSLITANVAARRIVHVVRGGPGRDRVVAVDFDEFWEGLSGWVIRERTPALSPAGIVDDREGPAARQRRQVTEAGSVMVVPLRYRGKVFGTMTAVNRPDERDFTHRDLELLGAMGNQAAMAIENARLFDEVQRLAVTDDLTGLANRRGFFELAKRELDRAERSGRAATAAMLDIDGFKKVNDTYGHAVGDEVLRHLADRCKLAVRDVDLVGRYGGEEFCFLLPETDLATAEFIADRLLARISGTPVQTEAGPLHIQVSIGLAQSQTPPESVAVLLDRADTAMYEAKQEGGNTARVAAPADL